MRYRKKLLLLTAAVVVAAQSAGLTVGAEQADEDLAKLEKHRCPQPTEFASVFSFGYGGDGMPKDNAKFEELLKKIKAGGFNVIHTSYTDQRLELCKKHGIKLMLDFLDVENHHVYKNVEGCKAVCAKVKGNPAVWGYNIWNDHFGGRGAGRRRDINTVRRWDPTHPAYSGGYRTDSAEPLLNADVMGYYDFHWERGIDLHFPHLLAYLPKARERNCLFYSWFSWRPGKWSDHYHRSLWSANTSIACGLKGILWFLGSGMMDQNTLQWKQGKTHVLDVNKEIMPLKTEIMKIGNPVAVYATKITKTRENAALPDGKAEMMPPGMEKNAFPADLWIQPAAGELVVGVFKDDQGRDAVFVASHNAYAEQEVKLKLTKPVKAGIFNRKKGQWEPLELKDQTAGLKLSAGGGELLRFQQ